MKTNVATLRYVSWLLCLVSPALLAQNTGTISGTIKDTSGAVLPDASIVILNQETGSTRSALSDQSGHYTAPSLSLGDYRLTVSKPGFQVKAADVHLAVGQDSLMDFVLAVGNTTQTVDVTAAAPPVDATSATLGTLVDGLEIRSLPLNGRSFDQLALLQPGVTQLNPGTTTNSLLRVGTGQRFSVGGLRAGTNAFLLDGTNISDQGNSTPGGASGTNLGVDTIQEFQVYTNSYKAEYGRSSGGIVTAVTRSGSNAFHGTAFEYIRNSVLDARNFFDVTAAPPPFRRNQFGGVLGGPIKRDKTFFFVGYEGVRQGQETTHIGIVPSANARQGILSTGNVAVSPNIVPYLQLWPLPNLTNFGDTGEFASTPNTITNDDNVMGRVDHRVNDSLSLFARYSYDNDGVWAPLSLPSQVNDTTDTRQSGTVQANYIVRPNIFDNVRLAFARSSAAFATLTEPASLNSLSFIPGVPLGELSIGGLQAVGVGPITALGTGGLPEKYGYTNLEFDDDLTWVKGNHTFKTGVTVQRLRDNFTNAPAGEGQYTFSSLANFMLAKPSTLQALVPSDAQDGLRQTLYGAYAQDDYVITPNLTLNLGLRWETVTNPTEVNGKSYILPTPLSPALVKSPDFFDVGKKNFEPRVGLAWRLNSSGKTVLRAGAGIYHNEIYPYIYFAQTRNGVYNTLSLSNPPFPNGYTSLLSGAASTALAINAPVMKTPAVDQYNVSLQQQVFANTVVQISYAGDLGRHMTIQNELDRYIPSHLPNGQEYFPTGDTTRINPAFSSIREWQDVGNSNYNSGSILLRRRSGTGIEYQLFYTFSKAMDIASNSGSVESARSATAPQNPDDARLDYGLAEFNVAHSLGANFTYGLPFKASSRVLGGIVNNWRLDGILTLQTGMPLTARDAASNSKDGSGVLADRPNLLPGFSPNPTHGTTGAGCTGIPANEALGTPTLWYNPCAFALSPVGTYGNLGRDTIIGPGIENTNVALEKTFAVRERMRVTFRAEMFNVLNHANFGLPNPTAVASSGAPNASAGVVTYTVTSARQLQFALRLNF
ncbi:MAG TPA: TonB-dependent receptor [Bryobacteraceae bacterium]|jgi:outer membrane receptor protein involved in Fe transport|nr:TonB-dependent receptor [Bryobacteraceae bacterium]